DKKTKDSIFYINVKFKGLRDVLRKVLKDIYRICLREDKPLNLLYNFLPELEFINVSSKNEVYLKYLDLLINFIKTTYASITKRLKPLFKNYKIIYNLL
ncbi:uncharacterized protein K441DRAFT_726984, partial [Cenococcum geophilum 1.58]|uniref:uncharacterized protein n=1 Tax=Cenococcum geophilum 1.58 TaxID=794803 RepID=UPI00358E03F8